MNRFNRFLAATFLPAAMLLPGTAQALDFRQFDRMDMYAQSEFVAVMIDTTQKALKGDGRADFAAQMEHLFTTIEPGDSMPLGLAEYALNEPRARLADAKRAEKDPNSRRLDVEDALFVTLKKNGIVMSRKAMNSVIDAMAHFHAETNAEFEAKSPAEQRRFIALLVRLAWPDYYLRDEVKSQIEHSESSIFSPQIRHDLLEIANTQFPSESPDQPGFAEVAKQIETETRKSPDKPGPIFEVVLYMLRQVQARVDTRSKDLEARAVVLPDGRHVYVDENGDFWFYPEDPLHSQEKAMKLDAQDNALAQRLAGCMTRHGISNGAEGLAACRDELGIPSSAFTSMTPTPALDAPQPQPTVDSAPPAPPEDDPIGPGGFITPPDR
jgi:hypothetical protein